MAKDVLLIEGHPDPAPERLCRQLARAYADGARAGGHRVETIDLARLDFPFLTSARDFEEGTPPPAIRDAQEAIDRSDHVVFVFPIWHGTEPALVKGFVEQVFRPGFARERPKEGEDVGRKRLTDTSVRIVSTMGMPALAYRYYFMGHGLKNLSNNVFRFSGMGPVRWTLVGGVGSVDEKRAAKEAARLTALGREAR